MYAYKKVKSALRSLSWLDRANFFIQQQIETWVSYIMEWLIFKKQMV